MKYEKQLNKWFDKFEHRMETEVPQLVAATASEFFRDRFKSQEWDKKPWPALNPKYATSKTRGKGRILTATGALRNSIKPTTITGRRVVITAGSAEVPYARAHNEGLKISGIAKVKSYTNTNFMGKKKKVTIPAHTRSYNVQFKRRRFMGHSKYLNEAIITRLTEAFKK